MRNISIRSTPHVVIIGCGIQGLSAAYHVALGGTTSVTVVESEDRPGKGSSSRSGSMLMKSRENRPQFALSLYSYARLMDFHDEFGESLYFRRTGFLSAVPPAMAERYEHEHRLRLSMDVPSERLTPGEIRRLAPGIITDDLAFGLLGPDDGEIRAEQLLSAYLRRGKELGVQYEFSERAVGLVMQCGRVAAVKTTKRMIACDIAVNAGGANAAEIASWVGIHLPISNCVRSLYIVKTDAPAFHQGPMVEDAGVEWYYRPLGDDRVLIGMGLEEDGEPMDGPNLRFLPELERAMARRAPTLSPFEVVGGSSGVRPLTPGILPILGPVAGVEGYLNSCGWGGEGIMHSPAGGSIIADYINGTSTCVIDRSSFLLSRVCVS